MDERTKLTGLARFSPRLNLLRRLADSENPILSISAMYLLRDRTARRIGGSVEFTFLVILPLISIALALATISTNTHYPERFYNSDFMEIAQQALFGLGYFARFLGCLYGFLLLTLPGVAITKREADGSLLRMLPMDRNEVFKGMLKLNLVSFFMPSVIFYLFEMGLVTAVWTFLSSILPDFYYWNVEYLGITPPSGRLFLVGWVVIFLLYATVYSIHPSFRYRLVWSAFMGIIAGILVLLLVLYFGMMVLMSAFTYNPPSELVAILIFLTIYSFLLFAAVSFARDAIAFRINPTK